ncbi:MAG: hypothetical protein G01um101420_468 [Parcubacteria group bacterium Gr01-1014_20]|nr:MAG: hypothetical protein G01um101420_468 [Parcubacteria group bacterium Gr01-1014_20]
MNPFEKVGPDQAGGDSSREEWEKERDAAKLTADQEKEELQKFVESLQERSKENLLAVRSQLEEQLDSTFERDALNPIRDRLAAVNNRLLELGVED